MWHGELCEAERARGMHWAALTCFRLRERMGWGVPGDADAVGQVLPGAALG